MFIGFAQDGELFKRDVLLKVIDKHTEFDSAMKSPRLLRMLMKASGSPTYSYYDPKGIKQIIAHILVKFPQLKKMNFMFIKSKRKAPKARFTDEDIKEFF